MTFKEATVTERVAVRDGSVKLGNLAQRLTIGSGPVDSGLATEIDALALTMQTALSDAGYSPVLPSGSVAVKTGDSITVSDGDGKSAAGTIAVADSTASATLPGTNAIVVNAQTIAVTGGTVTLAVSNGALTATYTAS